jgi:CRP-like cAMP-binding protein
MASEEDLRTIPLFALLSEAERKILVSITNKREFYKDNVIFSEAAPGRTLFIVKSGEVKITRLIRENDEIIMAMCKDGDLFGVISFIDGKEHSATAVCANDVVVFTINKADFDELTPKYPLLGIKILKCIGLENCLYLRAMNSKFHDMVAYVNSK